MGGGYIVFCALGAVSDKKEENGFCESHKIDDPMEKSTSPYKPVDASVKILDIDNQTFYKKPCVTAVARGQWTATHLIKAQMYLA